MRKQIISCPPVRKQRIKSSLKKKSGDRGSETDSVTGCSSSYDDDDDDLEDEEDDDNLMVRRYFLRCHPDGNGMEHVW